MITYTDTYVSKRSKFKHPLTVRNVVLETNLYVYYRDVNNKDGYFDVCSVKAISKITITNSSITFKTHDYFEGEFECTKQ